jgi:hypothetical protein
MWNSQRFFCADDTLPKDDIDELFEKLLPIEPPPALIQHILTSVSKLPLPTSLREEKKEKKKKKRIDGQVVQKDHLPPS